jgi:hypothetical protein
VVSSTIEAAGRFAAGQAAAIPARVVALAEGVLRTMWLCKLRNAAAVLVAAIVLTAGAAAVMSRTAAGEPPPKGKAARDAEPAAADKGGAKPRARWEYKAMTYDDIKRLEFNMRGTDTPDGGLNMLGDDGWELVAIEPGVSGPSAAYGNRPARYVFKRPKS